ncbi:MAG: twin-arginine translocase subunit TatC [Acidobacteriota bacterium]
MTDAAPSAGSADDAAEPERELSKMSFLEHLEELRKRLLISILAVVGGFFLCWNYAEPIFAIIQKPLTQFLAAGDQRLAYTRLTEPFFLYMKVAFFTGIFLASPIVILQIWLFITPGLYPRERRYAAPFVIFATLFFVAGGWFGYQFMLPAACKFFVDTGAQFKQMIKVDEYFSFASTVILSAGLVFETPILIFFLARLGIVTPAFLMQKLKYAVVLSFVIAAIVTPGPDMVTQTFLAVPMIALYLLGIGVAYLFGKKYD